MASIEKLLTGLVQGALTAEDAAAQLEQIVRAYPMHRAVILTRVQSDVASDRISHADGRALLAAIERGASDSTTTPKSPARTFQTVRATQIEPKSRDTTEVIDPDATLPSPRSGSTAARTLRVGSATEVSFRGVSTVQKTSLAAVAVLAIASGYWWYHSHLESRPAVPFAQLPAQTQQQFRDAMSEGEKAWALYEAKKFPGAVEDSVRFYARAYNLHPRNREAVAALKKVADEFLKLHGGSTEQRRQAAEFLQAQTDYFLEHAPGVDTAK